MTKHVVTTNEMARRLLVAKATERFHAAMRSASDEVGELSALEWSQVFLAAMQRIVSVGLAEEWQDDG